MKLGYADPPYPGCAEMYRDHPHYAGEVDHRALVEKLQTEFDVWILHTHVPGLRMMERERILPDDGIRICQWVKTFAAFKRNVPVAYAYEPVIIKSARKPMISGHLVMRDWIAEPITLMRGLIGAKPEKVCHWAFEIAGAQIGDDLFDLFPGTGAVARAWKSWRQQISFDLSGGGKSATG
jgi:hypothetical protein